MLKIVVMSALPREYAAFRKITAHWRPLEKKPFKKFARLFEDKEIVLMETGMGAQLAADALASVLASRPDLLIFSGFAGGLHPDLAVGEVCAAKAAVMLGHAGAQTAGKTIELRFPHELSAYFASKNIRPVTAVTVSGPPDKKALSALAAGSLAVVDMETAELARIAGIEGIPFLCLRAISDSLDDELGFDLADITGTAGKVEPLRVLRAIIRRPPVIGAFYRSWPRSLKAGKSLGAVLADLLKIPAPRLSRIARGIRIVS